jgi:histidine triad (HIT) family protein
MKECLFCKIISKQLPSKIVSEDEDSIAIYDINPQAPVHILVIPRKHLVNLNEAINDSLLLGKLLTKAVAVARSQGLENGYRVVINTGMEGGQSVDHLHLHVLGGRFMGWPPG